MAGAWPLLLPEVPFASGDGDCVGSRGAGSGIGAGGGVTVALSASWPSGANTTAVSCSVLAVSSSKGTEDPASSVAGDSEVPPSENVYGANAYVLSRSSAVGRLLGSRWSISPTSSRTLSSPACSTVSGAYSPRVILRTTAGYDGARNGGWPTSSS